MWPGCQDADGAGRFTFFCRQFSAHLALGNTDNRDISKSMPEDCSSLRPANPIPTFNTRHETRGRCEARRCCLPPGHDKAVRWARPVRDSCWVPRRLYKSSAKALILLFTALIIMWMLVTPLQIYVSGSLVLSGASVSSATANGRPSAHAAGANETNRSAEQGKLRIYAPGRYATTAHPRTICELSTFQQQYYGRRQATRGHYTDEQAASKLVQDDIQCHCLGLPEPYYSKLGNGF